jgi:hypothetical protein
VCVCVYVCSLLDSIRIYRSQSFYKISNIIY